MTKQVRPNRKLSNIALLEKIVTSKPDDFVSELVIRYNDALDALENPSQYYKKEVEENLSMTVNSNPKQDD